MYTARFFTLFLGLILSFTNTHSALAHFGMVIPSTNVITQEDKQIDLTLSFSHPFELVGMEMNRPKKVIVSTAGKSTDITASFSKQEVMGHTGWQSGYEVKRPGVYTFAMEPQPYWEPAEDLSIIHYTKTIVGAFGDDQGWDQRVGFPVEIIPYTRPFGNYAGNSFTGQVIENGEPVPGAEIEVELYNSDQRFTPVSDYHVTQVVVADDQGIFTFTCPKPGWWGFAALRDADYSLANPAGEQKGVELGGVLWIYLDSYLRNAQ